MAALYSGYDLFLTMIGISNRLRSMQVEHIATTGR